jgi:hypothetical protein
LQKIISADRAFNERDDAIALQKQISGVR